MDDKIKELKEHTDKLKSEYDAKLSDYLLIVKENQISINALTKIVERTSLDIDTLVKSQQDLMLNQKELNVFKEKIENLNEKVSVLEGNWTWIIRSIGASILTIIAGTIMFTITKKGA